MTHGTLEDIWVELDNALGEEENPYFLVNARNHGNEVVSALTLRKV